MKVSLFQAAKWLFILLPITVAGWINLPRNGHLMNLSNVRRSDKCLLCNSDPQIHYQDSENYGRGEMHLSAELEEGDLVVIKTGTWCVDGVEVGDGEPMSFKYVKVDTIQLVWTHDCEHGQIRGFSVNFASQEKDLQGRVRCFVDENEYVEFGPEQLVAKIPSVWDANDDSGGNILVSLSDADFFDATIS
mmetsp:Transcript_11095/g.14506  ORF Transcript_11095/g.14506 Transcript_11095/m.14506 type:complete len:190 (-) Transcript_11095:80-649(-)